MPPATAWYDQHSEELASHYDLVQPSTLYEWMADLLPAVPSLIVDVGAGSGRDASWFASMGHKVVAVEPSAAMRGVAKARFGANGVQWLEDSLPGLGTLTRAGLSADMVIVQAVWQHIAPEDRRRAFRKLTGTLRSGALLILSLRHGPMEEEREFYPVTLAEVERLSSEQGMAVVRVSEAADLSGRSSITWTNVAMRLPDDGTGALPLLRHVILDQSKSATYKLGLLRAVCRAADSSAGLAREDDDHVVLPLGLLALNWIRLYLPLLLADLPQTPRNRSADGLSFAKEGFRSLMNGLISPLDLRVGMHFGTEAGIAIYSALREAADTIVSMPARYLVYPNGGPILLASRHCSFAPTRELSLDTACLWSFGEVRVPRHLWRALARFAAWIEPSLTAEWARLMRNYAERQGRRLDETRLAAALTWADPNRDVSLPRRIAETMLTQGESLFCVWSGKRLESGVLDMDHCFPWTAWPCGDLWNLLPAHRRVNQHEKKGRLPSERTLRDARDPIEEWWRRAYLKDTASALANRFSIETASSLPVVQISGGVASPDQVFTALQLQRLRLWQNQQVPEWQSMRTRS